MREYEAKLAEMSNLASRQADDISSLRTVAEKSLHEKALAEARAAAVAEATAAQASAAQQSSTSSFDEERWRQLMAEANSTQEQALANGQRQLHALAASLQAAQRMAAEQQAAEWRAALHEASEAHALVVRQLQSQLMASSEEKRALQQDLREARRASLANKERADARARQRRRRRPRRPRRRTGRRSSRSDSRRRRLRVLTLLRWPRSGRSSRRRWRQIAPSSRPRSLTLRRVLAAASEKCTELERRYEMAAREHEAVSERYTALEASLEAMRAESKAAYGARSRARAAREWASARRRQGGGGFGRNSARSDERPSSRPVQPAAGGQRCDPRALPLPPVDQVGVCYGRAADARHANSQFDHAGGSDATSGRRLAL